MTLFGYVLPSVLVIVLLWIVANPDAAERWTKILWQIISYFFSACTRRYAASAVQSDADRFINKTLLSRLGETELIRIKVDWVEKAADARLHVDGKVIVRMRRDRDQKRNVITAIQTALPHIFFPNLRPYINPRFSTTIDLLLLQMLVATIGGSANKIYHADILGPAIANDSALGNALEVLRDINAGGLFDSVLIQELFYLNDLVLNQSALKGIESELREFVSYLHYLATRSPHDESGDLEFIKGLIKTAFILTSKSITAAKGTLPYERRLNIDLLHGAESIYLLGLTVGEENFCNEIARQFDNNPSVDRIKTLKIAVLRQGKRVFLPLIHFRRNKLRLQEGDFRRELKRLGFEEGRTVKGRVTNLLDDRAQVDVEALDAEIMSSDLLWGANCDVSQIFKIGEEAEFLILKIDIQRSVLTLGKKQLSKSPWDEKHVPGVGEKCKSQVVGKCGPDILVKFIEAKSELFGRLPKDEWSWIQPNSEHYIEPAVGTTVDVEVLSVNKEENEIVVSHKVLEAVGWEDTLRRFPAQTRVRVTVVRVEHQGLYCQVDDGIFGWIDRQNVIAAGHELEDYQKTVVVGQQFDAVVIKGKHKRRYLQMKLARTRLEK